MTQEPECWTSNEGGKHGVKSCKRTAFPISRNETLQRPSTWERRNEALPSSSREWLEPVLMYDGGCRAKSTSFFRYGVMERIKSASCGAELDKKAQVLDTLEDTLE
jgi:hypothetical protein